MPTTLGKYQLGKTLGSGVSCKVKLAKDDSGTRYAVKILHKDEAFSDLIKTEVDSLKHLKHPNIVNMVEVSKGRIINQKKPHKDKDVEYIVLELVQGGELFDFVAMSGKFTENVARFYFAQLMGALNYMHNAGACHRDLKPENVMLDSEFNLKVADFGFAAPTKGRDGSGFLTTQLGTASYMAPEIHLGKPYTGQGVDLFASAIILFVMLSQRPPFSSPNPNDAHYRLLAANRPDLFWKAHDDADGGQSIYSKEFKDLFTKMTVLNPAQRMNMAQVLAHPWMQGAKAGKNEIRTEFVNRKKEVDAEAAKDKEEKRAERADRGNKKKVTRGQGKGEEDESEDEEQSWQQLEMEDFEVTQQKTTQFFSTSSAAPIFSDLKKILKDSQPQISSDKWKMKFTQKTKQSGLIKVVVNILRVDDQTICVEFSRQNGDQLAFFDFFKETKKALSIYNDATFAV